MEPHHDSNPAITPHKTQIRASLAQFAVMIGAIVGATWFLATRFSSLMANVPTKAEVGPLVEAHVKAAIDKFAKSKFRRFRVICPTKAPRGAVMVECDAFISLEEP